MASVIATLAISHTPAPAPVSIARPSEVIVQTIPEKIAMYASEYDVSADVISNIINCESKFKPTAVGDNGNSYGLVQIHLPSHPEITKEQALDPDFAIDYLADQMSKGNAKQWSCYRLLYE